MKQWTVLIAAVLTFTSLEVFAAKNTFIRCDGVEIRYDFDFKSDGSGMYNAKFFYNENGQPKVDDFQFIIRNYPREIVAYWLGPIYGSAGCTLLKKIFEPKNLNVKYNVSCLDFYGREFFVSCQAIQ